jgi:hypothetical protein
MFKRSSEKQDYKCFQTTLPFNAAFPAYRSDISGFSNQSDVKTPQTLNTASRRPFIFLINRPSLSLCKKTTKNNTKFTKNTGTYKI